MPTNSFILMNTIADCSNTSSTTLNNVVAVCINGNNDWNSTTNQYIDKSPNKMLSANSPSPPPPSNINFYHSISFSDELCQRNNSSYIINNTTSIHHHQETIPPINSFNSLITTSISDNTLIDENTTTTTTTTTSYYDNLEKLITLLSNSNNKSTFNSTNNNNLLNDTQNIIDHESSGYTLFPNYPQCNINNNNHSIASSNNHSPEYYEKCPVSTINLYLNTDLNDKGNGLDNICTSFNTLEDVFSINNSMTSPAITSLESCIVNTSSTNQSYNTLLMKKKAQNLTECVPVPSSEHVAEIVGRQGCKIKALRAKTNTYIKTPVRGEEPVFVVTGRKEDVIVAKTEILTAAEHFSSLRASRKQSAPMILNASCPIIQDTSVNPFPLIPTTQYFNNQPSYINNALCNQGDFLFNNTNTNMLEEDDDDVDGGGMNNNNKIESSSQQLKYDSLLLQQQQPPQGIMVTEDHYNNNINNSFPLKQDMIHIVDPVNDKHQKYLVDTNLLNQPLLQSGTPIVPLNFDRSNVKGGDISLLNGDGNGIFNQNVSSLNNLATPNLMNINTNNTNCIGALNNMNNNISNNINNLLPNLNQQLQGQITIRVRVPYKVVGLVVGPKGATIKRIQQTTQTYIVTPSRDREPVFEITGTPTAVHTARIQIENHISVRTANGANIVGNNTSATNQSQQCNAANNNVNIHSNGSVNGSNVDIGSDAPNFAIYELINNILSQLTASHANGSNGIIVSNTLNGNSNNHFFSLGGSNTSLQYVDAINLDGANFTDSNNHINNHINNNNNIKINATNNFLESPKAIQDMLIKLLMKALSNGVTTTNSIAAAAAASLQPQLSNVGVNFTQNHTAPLPPPPPITTTTSTNCKSSQQLLKNLDSDKLRQIFNSCTTDNNFINFDKSDLFDLNNFVGGGKNLRTAAPLSQHRQSCFGNLGSFMNNNNDNNSYNENHCNMLLLKENNINMKNHQNNQFSSHSLNSLDVNCFEEDTVRMGNQFIEQTNLNNQNLNMLLLNNYDSNNNENGSYLDKYNNIDKKLIYPSQQQQQRRHDDDDDNNNNHLLIANLNKYLNGINNNINYPQCNVASSFTQQTTDKSPLSTDQQCSTDESINKMLDFLNETRMVEHPRDPSYSSLRRRESNNNLEEVVEGDTYTTEEDLANFRLFHPTPTTLSNQQKSPAFPRFCSDSLMSGKPSQQQLNNGDGGGGSWWEAFKRQQITQEDNTTFGNDNNMIVSGDDICLGSIDSPPSDPYNMNQLRMFQQQWATSNGIGNENGDEQGLYHFQSSSSSKWSNQTIDEPIINNYGTIFGATGSNKDEKIYYNNKTNSSSSSILGATNLWGTHSIINNNNKVNE